MEKDDLYLIASEIKNLPENNKLREIESRLEKIYDHAQKKMMICHECGRNGLQVKKLIKEKYGYICADCSRERFELINDKKKPYDPESERGFKC